MTSDWVTTGLSAVVILAAAAVHGIAGFGFAQVSMGIMPLFRSPSSASIIFTATAVVANARVWWSVRDAFDWGEVDRSCRWARRRDAARHRRVSVGSTRHRCASPSGRFSC